MSDQKKKRGRTAAAPELRKNHLVPVALNGYQRAQLNEMIRDSNKRLRDLKVPATVSDSTFMLTLLQNAWDDFVKEHGEITVIPVIKVDSQSSATGTDE